MMHGDTQTMPGVYRGVPKHSVRPIVDGIVCGVPRRAHVPSATPREAAPGHSATLMPAASFGSGIFQEGAGPTKAGTPSKSHAPAHEGTKKGMPRKTARKAYEK